MKLKFLFLDYVALDEEQEDDFRAWQPCKFVQLHNWLGSADPVYDNHNAILF